MIILLQYTILFALVLSIVALGACFCEHSGIINLGLEGIMVFGSMCSALVMRDMSSDMNSFLVVFIATIVSVIGGMFFSSLLAIATVYFRADQTLVGMALNMFGVAVATVIVKAINISKGMEDFSATVKYNNVKNAFIINFGRFEFSWLTIVVVVCMICGYFVLYKTKFGLRLIACGENPHAADFVGIRVTRIRFVSVLISGGLGGLGGLIYITAGVCEWQFEYGVAGFGFLALAVLIFGNWKPQNIALGALVFGFFRALASTYKGIPFLLNLNIPKGIYISLPYIICLIILFFTSKKSNAPKAEGIPYIKNTK